MQQATTDSPLGKVLIVEDELELAELLEFNLQRAGLETRVAADGLSACRQIKPEHPDLILLDLMLPDLEGWEICRLVREHLDPTVASTPIVMVTALSNSGDKMRGLELGADDYIYKPFSVREVVAKALNLVAKRRQHLDLCAQVRNLEEEKIASSTLQDFLLHEIKNKLVVIGGFSNRLSSPTAEEPEGNSHRYLEAITRSTEYLGAMAEELLLLRKLEGNEIGLPPQDVPVHQLIAELIDIHRPEAEAKQIAVLSEAEHPGTSALHPGALRIILSNLIENAIRYGRHGGQVRLRLHDDRLCTSIEVTDDGPGIAADELDQVTHRFYRGRQFRERTKGTGLGLYIVKTLTEAMGGRVQLNSQPKQGTSIQLLFPVTRPAADKPSAEPLRAP